MKVLTDRNGSLARIILNDPDALNALSPELLDELMAALSAAIEASDVRGIVLTGAGRGFCAGAHLESEIATAGAGVGDFLRSTINRIVTAMRSSPKPIVVAVNGVAAGAGVGIALAGDIVLAASNARFVLSFARIGAALDAATSKLVQSAIGGARARALALLGAPIYAREAENWGLIWKSVEADELLGEAEAVAATLAAGPSIALGLIKTELEFAETANLSAVLEFEAETQARAFETNDLREGVAAFNAKRAAHFKGR